MKRFCLFFVLCSLLFSCKVNTIHGWNVNNNSNQQIEVYFNNEKYVVDGNSVSYLENIPEQASVFISENYHIDYTISYKYSTSSYNTKLLTITDKKKYTYIIKNNYTDTVNYKLNGSLEYLSAGEQKELLFYDSPVDFTFYSDNFIIPYTQNIDGSIIYIFIYKTYS